MLAERPEQGIRPAPDLGQQGGETGPQGVGVLFPSSHHLVVQRRTMVEGCGQFLDGGGLIALGGDSRQLERECLFDRCGGLPFRRQLCVHRPLLPIYSNVRVIDVRLMRQGGGVGRRVGLPESGSAAAPAAGRWRPEVDLPRLWLRGECSPSAAGRLRKLAGELIDAFIGSSLWRSSAATDAHGGRVWYGLLVPARLPRSRPMRSSAAAGMRPESGSVSVVVTTFVAVRGSVELPAFDAHQTGCSPRGPCDRWVALAVNGGWVSPCFGGGCDQVAAVS